MQVHKIVLTVIDFDGIGQQGVIGVLENARYPNRCIAPRARSVESRDIGEWCDEHPLNHASTSDAELARLFGA